MAKFLSCTQKYSVAVNMLTLDNFKFKWDCNRLLPSDPQPCFSSRGLTDHAPPPEGHQCPHCHRLSVSCCLHYQALSTVTSHKNSWLSDSQYVLQLIPNCPKKEGDCPKQSGWAYPHYLQGRFLPSEQSEGSMMCPGSSLKI